MIQGWQSTYIRRVRKFLHRQDQTDEEQIHIRQSIAQVLTDLGKATLRSTSDVTMPQGTENDVDIVSLFGNGPIKESTEDNELNELSDQGHIPITHDKDSPLIVKHQADEKRVEVESEGGKKRDNAPTDNIGDEGSAREMLDDEFFDDDIEDTDGTQGTCVDYEEGSCDSLQSSRPAGPETLWGILHSNQSVYKAEDRTFADNETAEGYDHQEAT